MNEDPDRAPGSVPPPGAGATELRGSEQASTTAAAVPQDTDDMLGTHFGALARAPLTLSIGATAMIAAFVIGTTQAGASIGAAAAVGVALIAAVIVYAVASSRAEEDFFEHYASARGLQRRPDGRLPPTTPLLRKGDKRYADQIMNGTLPGGLPGALALYTYEEHTTDSDGTHDETKYRFTVVMHDIPSVAEAVSDVHCQRRSGFRFLDSAEDVFRRMQRLELESETLDKRYEIFFGAGDDENWMKQLFSPSFIVWLAEEAPRDFAFEFSAGGLCVSVKGHHDNAAELDQLCESAALVAGRLADEAAE